MIVIDIEPPVILTGIEINGNFLGLCLRPGQRDVAKRNVRRIRGTLDFGDGTTMDDGSVWSGSTTVDASGLTTTATTCSTTPASPMPSTTGYSDSCWILKRSTLNW